MDMLISQTRKLIYPPEVDYRVGQINATIMDSMDFEPTLAPVTDRRRSKV